MVLGLIFKSLFHFVFIFMYGLRTGSSFIYFCIQLSSFPYTIKKPVYPHCLFCLLCDHIEVDLFLSVLFFFIDLCVCFNVSSVQLLIRVRLFSGPWIRALQVSLSISNSQSVLKLISIESVIPSIFPRIRIFSNESALHIRWPKYWSFSYSISPSNEHPGLLSFRMDWLDLLAVQGTCKSLLQHHSSKALIILCPAFFTVQLSHPHMTTGRTIALTRHLTKCLCFLICCLVWS